MGELTPLWTPSADQIEKSAMTLFRRWCAEKFGVDLPDHDAFHQWSITERGPFWSAVWDYCGVKGDKARAI